MQEHFVSCADAWLAEGEAKGIAAGEQRGRAQVVEGLLRAGVGWEVIEQDAGLDESGYRALRERLASGS